MKVSFLGAAEEVGRSCIIISTERTKIMLDAGLEPGKERLEFPAVLEKDIRGLDGVFLTHAHLDHCCFVPHLFARKYQGKVYGTKPTLELMNVQVADYVRLSSPQEVTKEVLEKVAKGIKVLEYKQPFRIKDLTVEFIPAGHILGSALLRVSDGKETILYTGDINLSQTKLLEGADLTNLAADTLITETTYGGKDDIHPNEKELARKMITSIKGTITAGGKVIIPSFAVQRGQEVLLFLDDFMNSGQLPKVPIYVDGAIGKVLRIHRHNVIYCREEIQRKILMSDYDPFKSENFVFVEAKTMRDKIINGGPCIIVTTSGMLSGGPVVFYLKKLAGDKLNKLILVGYQANGTEGRDLLDGAKEIDFHDTRLQIRLGVEMTPMSAHADRKQLESIPKHIKGLKSIFLVHGEKSKMDEMKEVYQKAGYKTMIPKIGETFDTLSPEQPVSRQEVKPESVERVQPQRQQRPSQQRQRQQREPQRPQQRQQPRPSQPQREPQQRPMQRAGGPAQQTRYGLPATRGLRAQFPQERTGQERPPQRSEQQRPQQERAPRQPRPQQPSRSEPQGVQQQKGQPPRRGPHRRRRKPRGVSPSGHSLI